MKPRVSMRGTTAGFRVVRTTACAVVALGALALAPAAQGAVTCDYAQSGLYLEVLITESNELVTLDVANGTIRAFDYITPATCTSNPAGLTPTVTNTNSISVSALPGVLNTTLIIDDAPAFAPGASAEAGGTPEIEIFVNLRDPQDSLLSIRTGDLPGTIRFGTSGINTNATPAEIVPDVDITPSNVADMDARSSGNYQLPVTLDASGGGVTGGAIGRRMELLGSRVADTLVGGDGGDDIFAAEGADTVRGGPGDDELTAGPGDDTIDGGPGTDVVDESGAGLTTGIVVDLALTGPQPTGGAGVDSFASVENLVATQFADILSGDAGRNVLVSGSGPDFIDGRGGADTLRTGPGADTINARDGEPDVIDCGSEVDSVTADKQGVDTLTGCEEVAFPAGPATGGGGGGGAPGAGSGGTGGGAGGGGGGPVLRPFVVAPSAFQALSSGPSARPAARRVRGTLVAFALDRAGSVAFRVVRLAPGLRSRGRCVSLVRAPGSVRRCTRVVPARGSFVRAARAGSNRFAFSGRIGGKALAPGTYRLIAVPRAGSVSGPAARARFRILP